MNTLERIAEALERIAVAMEKRATTTVSSIPPEGLSKEDAARFVGVDVAAIEQWIRTRRIGYVQHGSQRGRLIPVESLRTFLREYLQEALNGADKRPQSVP